MNDFRNQALQLDIGFATSISALITALGMHWENQERIQNGHPPAYNSKVFFEIIEKFKLDEPNIRDRYRHL